MKVTFYFREYRSGNFSIEMLFKTILSSLGLKVMPSAFYVKSKINLGSVIKAFFSQGEVNHITGDVNYLALVLKGEKTLLTIHDIGHYEHTLSGWKKYMYRKIWFEWPLRKVAAITTVSEFSKNKLIETFAIEPSKIKVVYNPVPSAFLNSPKVFNKDCFRILQIGSGLNKNVQNLIKAVEGLSCELILIRRFDKKIEDELNGLGIAHTWHYNLTENEVLALYKSSDIVYFASTYEGFGLPIIEAQAIGRPVITSNVASMPEVAGEGACLVNPHDWKEIRNAIVKISSEEDYRNELISKGSENSKRFSADEIANEYIGLYTHVLNQNS